MQGMIQCRGINLPHDDRFICAKVAKRLSNDMYETPEVTGLSKFVTRSDRVLELGSGLGFVSSYLATQIGVEKIFCVEANPDLCAYIERVHEANNVHTANVENAVALPDCAAWPDDGRMPFYITSPFWSSSLNRPRGKQATQAQVPAIRLSEMVARIRPTVIICDIEGGEETLFETVDLSGVRYIYMELHTRVYGGAGVRKIFNDMHRHNFFYHQKASCADVVLFERLDLN